MYAKPSMGGLLAFAGAGAMPTVAPALRVARLLLEITGAGFILYCTAAAGLCVLGYLLRWHDRLRERREIANFR